MTTDHGDSTAHEVHGLLLDAHPEIHDANLAKAAHLAETAGVPSDHLQLETFVAIRNLQTAIENGLSAAARETLLLRAIRLAEKWAMS